MGARGVPALRIAAAASRRPAGPSASSASSSPSSSRLRGGRVLAGWVLVRRSKGELLPVVVGYLLVPLGTWRWIEDAATLDVAGPPGRCMRLAGVGNYVALIVIFALFPDGQWRPRWARWAVAPSPPGRLPTQPLWSATSRVARSQWLDRCRWFLDRTCARCRLAGRPLQVRGHPDTRVRSAGWHRARGRRPVFVPSCIGPPWRGRRSAAQAASVGLAVSASIS